MEYLLLKPIDTSTLFIVIGLVAAIAVVFAVLIVAVSKLCAVKEDEKAKAVSEHLAGANCGGCGFAGCADFAKALSEGKADINGCGATPNEEKAAIAEILGVPFTAAPSTFAVVKCSGGNNCADRFSYTGNKDCAAEASFNGGRKACPFGCVGDGTCAFLCPENAIRVRDGVASSDRRLCTSCGACARNCPKKLVAFIPKTAKVFVACSSECRGKEVMDACKAGCIGCGLCAKNCPEGAIIMTNNLPVIDYKKCKGCGVCADKCPRKCIKKL